MNCSALHRELLALESLDPAPPAARAHLAECAACRSWYRKLTTVERLAPQTAVPPPRQKAAFIERFLAMKEEPEPVLQFPTTGRSGENPRLVIRQRAQRKTALAVALAASLALVALGIWAWQGYKPGGQGGGGGNPSRPVSRLQKKLNENPRWTAAKSPREKIEILDGIAQELEARTTELVSANQIDSEALSAEVELYCDVIDTIASREARQIPRAERPAVLKEIADRLDRFQGRASSLANRQTNAEAAASLRRLAAAAQDGQDRLRTLL